ncbi:MAG: Uma2 family endonuclease, partial [Anaerolineae bacterium]
MAAEREIRWAVEVAQLWPPQGEWTEEEYFALPDTNRIVELSEGELIMPPLPTFTHQAVVGNLYRALHSLVTERDLGVVQMAPLPVRLWPEKIREPDVLFISREHFNRIGEQVCGVPDLIVEVISASTSKPDRVEKFAEYARAGVNEYWIVDPEREVVEVYVLRKGTYEPQGLWKPGQRARSELLEG